MWLGLEGVAEEGQAGTSPLGVDAAGLQSSAVPLLFLLTYTISF